VNVVFSARRKQKWSVDPRNSAWSNDDSKFGQKMLERMGWSKGKVRLGRTEQGSTDHIKVSVKNNKLRDNWIAHQDDFNELLAQLNNCHSQNNTDDQKGFSLEEKSKTSRNRVHYMKFTKGKDLSSRSETDLNCIFGKRNRSSRDPEQDGSSSDSQMDTDGAGTTCELESETITKTVTSALTMQEYFAQRMAQLKKARGASAALQEPDQDQTDELQKKKKKKKRRKEEVEVIAEDQNQQEPSKKKKKKKRKTAENVEDENCKPQKTDQKKMKNNKNKAKYYKNKKHKTTKTLHNTTNKSKHKMTKIRQKPHKTNETNDKKDKKQNFTKIRRNTANARNK
uniref:PIN2 (TERF1) interacting telomerase inhibitor 1 n=1 Tax=Amphiprion percula TaxID=161767 RepID=A0A3P8SJX4_AMPPE